VTTEPCAAVVLAAGAIDSTMIALRSTSSDFPEGLGNSHGVLGRYLHDHPHEWWVAETDRPMTALSHPVYIARPPHAASKPLMGTSLTIGLASSRHRLRTYLGLRARQFGVQVFGTLVPQEESRVTIDPQDMGDVGKWRPTIRLAYDSEVVANLLSARERLRDVFSSSMVGVRIPGPFHELRPGSSVHLAGTMRMHDDPRYGVVDRWNRMHDAPNVIVADSSCFTTGPEKNPTLTAMAIAIRAAERLAKDLKARGL
jgi:choline dehydrogenase-like flavoprotein